MFKIIEKLSEFWIKHGGELLPAEDSIMGAATYNRYFFFKALSSENFNNYYIQPTTRLNDCRFGTSPIRFLKHLQFQVVIRPIPVNIRDIYLESLKYIGLDGDVNFIPNDWKSEALGARGVGYEVRFNGLEITQYTYFTHLGNQSVEKLVEFAYGIERLAFVLNKKIPDFLLFQDYSLSKFHNEKNTDISNFFKLYESIDINNSYVAYSQFLELNNIFNQLDLEKKLNNTNRVEIIKKLQILIEKISINSKNINIKHA